MRPGVRVGTAAAPGPGRAARTGTGRDGPGVVVGIVPGRAEPSLVSHVTPWPRHCEGGARTARRTAAAGSLEGWGHGRRAAGTRMAAAMVSANTLWTRMGSGRDRAQHWRAGRGRCSASVEAPAPADPGSRDDGDGPGASASAR